MAQLRIILKLLASELPEQGSCWVCFVALSVYFCSVPSLPQMLTPGVLLNNFLQAKYHPLCFLGTPTCNRVTFGVT